MSGRTAFAKASREMGVAFPEEAARFVLSERECRFFDPPHWASVLSLANLYPGVPCRVLPLLEAGNGDHMGLFFPRDGGRPFVVDFNHEESAVAPVTSDDRFFFANPDRFSYFNQRNKKHPPRIDGSAWTHLLVDARGAVPELELLKPLSLHYREVEQRLEEMFGPILKRFGSEGIAATLVRSSFSEPAHLEERRRWFSLSEGLARAGLWREAIQALDNCHALHFIHPRYCGTRGRGGWPWRPVLEVFERMLTLVKVHGDRFDQVTIPHQVKRAREFAKG